MHTGEPIGGILALQCVLGLPVSDEGELRRQGLETLQQMHQELKTRLNESRSQS